MKLIQRLLNSRKNNNEVINKAVQPNYHDYYLLECWNQYAELPALLVPYVDKIKTREEWEALGFVLDINSLGQIRKIKVDNKYFSFVAVTPSHKIEKEAIKTGKRLTQNPGHIRLLLAKGCQPGEFLHIPATIQAEDVK